MMTDTLEILGNDAKKNHVPNETHKTAGLPNRGLGGISAGAPKLNLTLHMHLNARH